MPQRSLYGWIGAGFTIAAIAAVFAVLSFLDLVALAEGWTLIFAGAAILAVTVLAQGMLRDSQAKVQDLERQSQLLATQLEEQRASVDALADGLDIAVLICDTKAEVRYANRRAMELFRFHNPVGRSVMAVTLSEELQRLVVDAANSNGMASAEVTLTEPMERIGIAKAWAVEGSPNRIFLSIYEITELRRLMRIRQDFVANVSHEIRTPLTVIRAMAETLLDDDSPVARENRLRYCQRIVDEVDRLSAITQDLLAISAAESVRPEKAACDIADVWRNSVEELMPRAKEKGLALRFEGPEHLSINANPTQMSQVATNLIQNAISYTNTGAIDVCLSLVGNQVAIEVIDTGIGISTENKSRVFERFYRVDKGRSRLTGGTGLGLSIVKHIVESHGGTIDVRSTLNVGSTFTVTLPVD